MPNLLMRYFYIRATHGINANKWFCLYFEKLILKFCIGTEHTQHCTLANAERTGAVLRVIPMNENGELIMSTYDQLLSDKTKIVTVNHISNALGTINPVKYMIEHMPLAQPF
jgi:hypothetical protein